MQTPTFWHTQEITLLKSFWSIAESLKASTCCECLCVFASRLLMMCCCLGTNVKPAVCSISADAACLLAAIKLAVSDLGFCCRFTKRTDATDDLAEAKEVDPLRDMLSCCLHGPHIKAIIFWNSTEVGLRLCCQVKLVQLSTSFPSLHSGAFQRLGELASYSCLSTSERGCSCRATSCRSFPRQNA